VAGDQCLGVIAVQSYETPLAYDSSHQEVLATIAAQAAVAIQNANLYARTDEALARRVQELNSILRTTREGILLLDLGWRVLAANRALADLVGSAQLDLAGQTLDAPQPGREKPLVELLGYKLADLEADCQDLSRGEWTRKRAVVALGPPERHVERTLAPVRDREGTITAWLLVFRDMTEEVELARLREDMTHMLVHDLRSPLTVLKSSLEMMKLIGASGDAESLDKFLAMAQRGSERMLSMVNELLDVSKLEAGQLVLHPEPVEVESLLKDTAARLALLASAAQITLEIAAEPDLPPLHVDSQLVARVLNNLVDNAIKFTPDDGHIRLWARLDAASAPGAMLVGVSDTGPGIPAEERDKLFAKFQVTSTSGRRAGTGLGLAFCKLAVEAHGGEIWAESEPGQGSTFVMTLPIS
jgi:PAS domain S-box-containing protein